MPFLPKQITSLIGGDSVVSRVNNNVRAAVQPTLDFLNNFMAAGADGTLQIIQKTKFLGELVVSGSFSALKTTLTQLDVSGDVTVNNGNVVIHTRSTNGVAIVPQGGSPAFYITDPANTRANFRVNSDGGVFGANTWNTTSFVSGQGFKSWLPPLQYWNPSYPGSYQNLVVPLVNPTNNGTGATPWQMPMVRAGSITGLSLVQAGDTNATCELVIYKNGGVLIDINMTGPGSAFATQTFAKGTYPFATGDVLVAKINYSAAPINACVTVFIEVEEGA